MSCGNQLDTWRVNGVVGGTAEQEEKEAALVWRVKWPCYQRMDLMRRRVWKTKGYREEEYSGKQGIWPEFRAADHHYNKALV